MNHQCAAEDRLEEVGGEVPVGEEEEVRGSKNLSLGYACFGINILIKRQVHPLSVALVERVRSGANYSIVHSQTRSIRNVPPFLWSLSARGRVPHNNMSNMSNDDESTILQAKRRTK
jgi:hypothetical protein